MNCLIEFFSDNKQKDLRRLAQNQSECYEDTLEIYKGLFISYFLQIKDRCNNENCNMNNNCNEFKKAILEIKTKDIEVFFDNMKKIYIYWIDAKVKDSLELFIKTMDNYRLWDFYDNDIKKDIFFKGRIDKSILTKWEMFHIPFNKRYLIKNQRYSLTGQPIIYLGKSILDIMKELDIDDESSKYLKISSVKIKDDLKVYDLRNDIYKILNKMEFFNLFGEKKRNDYKQEFFKILLSSICSFERRKEHKDYTFCEEYVIPQILAQTLKNKEYDGVIYYSTKKFDDIHFLNPNDNLEVRDYLKENNRNKEEYINNNQIKNINKNSKYKENVALFTNFNKEHVYDEELYKKLEISSPINFSKVQDYTIEDLENICKKIESIQCQKEIYKSQVILEIFKREFNNIMINKTNYKDIIIGRMHIYHLYCILNQILCKCARCKDEFISK